MTSHPGQGAALTPSSQPLARYLGPARSYAAAAKSPRTLKAYESDWADFLAFCQRAGQDSLPAAPELVALYLTHLADERKLKTSTITRRLAAISQAHQAAGFPTPTSDAVVRSVAAGIRRVHGTQRAAKTALSPDLLRTLVAGLPETAPRPPRPRPAWNTFAARTGPLKPECSGPQRSDTGGWSPWSTMAANC